MQMRFNTQYHQWEVCFPQSGSFNGWSDWQIIDRQEALNFIEKGWSFNYH